MRDKDIDNALSQLETDSVVSELKKEISSLKSEVSTLKAILQDNGIDVSNLDISIVTEEEQICLDGISHLAKIFKNGTFTKDDAAMFDILHKNYRMIKGKTIEAPKKKASKEEIGELLKLVSGGKQDS